MQTPHLLEINIGHRWDLLRSDENVFLWGGLTIKNCCFNHFCIVFSLLSMSKNDVSEVWGVGIHGEEREREVQGSLLFITYTIIQSIISSEMQVELKKNKFFVANI